MGIGRDAINPIQTLHVRVDQPGTTKLEVNNRSTVGQVRAGIAVSSDELGSQKGFAMLSHGSSWLGHWDGIAVAGSATFRTDQLNPVSRFFVGTGSQAPTYFMYDNNVVMTVVGVPRRVGIGGTNVINPRATLEVDGNVLVGEALALGNNTLDGTMPGDINVSEIFYDTLTSKSPPLFYFDGKYLGYFDGKWVECSGNKDLHCPLKIKNKIQTIETKRTQWNSYQKDRGKCNLEQNDFPSFIEWKSGKKDCVFNNSKALAYCEKNETAFYWDSVKRKCKVNPRLNCIINYSNTMKWDVTSMSCVVSKQKTCEISGDDWVYGKCVINNKRRCLKQKNKKMENGQCVTDLKRKCEQNKNKIWSGSSCVNAASLGVS